MVPIVDLACARVVAMHANAVTEGQGSTVRNRVRAVFEKTASVGRVTERICRHQTVIAYVPTGWMPQVHRMIEDRDAHLLPFDRT